MLLEKPTEQPASRTEGALREKINELGKAADYFEEKANELLAENKRLEAVIADQQKIINFERAEKNNYFEKFRHACFAHDALRAVTKMLPEGVDKPLSKG